MNLPRVWLALLALAWAVPAWGQATGSDSNKIWSDFDKAFPSHPAVSPGPLDNSMTAATPVEKGTPEPMPTPNGTSGKIEYLLNKDPSPTPDQVAMYARITAAMDKAIWYYENYTTDLRGKRLVLYSPGTPTADANFKGPIRFGGQCNVRVAMHEMMHTFGVGTTGNWQKLMQGGVFTGKHATEQMREITGDPTAVVHGDHQHFWPYGLNYDTEVHSNDDLIRHCLMVEAIWKDLQEVH